MFHRGHRPRIAPPEERPGQIQPWQHGRQQPAQRGNVFGAVVQQCHALRIRERAATDGQLPQFVFLRAGHRGETVGHQRPQQPGTARSGQAVRGRAELKEQIQRPLRGRPSQLVEHGELRRSRVGHEEGPAVRAERGGRQPRQLVFPEAQLPARPQFLRHEADRGGAVAGRRGVFRVGQPDLFETVQRATGHDCPRSCRTSGWSRSETIRSRNAVRRISGNVNVGHSGSGRSVAGSKCS